MNTKSILAPFAVAFVAIVTGCSGAAPEESDIQSSELKGPNGGKGAPSKEPGKEAPPETPSDKKEPTEDKGDPGKEPSDDGSCIVEVVKSSCQSDDAWKNAAAKICDGKGLSLSALSTAEDCKGGSTVAKIECCK